MRPVTSKELSKAMSVRPKRHIGRKMDARRERVPNVKREAAAKGTPEKFVPDSTRLPTSSV